MKRSTIAIAISAVFVALILPTRRGRADAPLAPPEKKTLWSANRRFFAVMEPAQEITTIYRVTATKQAEKAWSMYGWFRVAALADDGEHLVAGYAGENLLPLDHDERQVMLYFFKRGELIRHVTLDQIIRDRSKLRRTVSHYYWGQLAGLDPDGRYVVETVEGRRLRFDVTKGTPIIEESTPGKAAEPRP